MFHYPDVAAYTRPEVGGLVLGVQESRSATFDARDLPDDPAAFSPTQGEEHWDILVNTYEAVAQFFPAIENAQFSSYICGLSSYTPDGEIILGPVPDVSGFYAAAGACGSGIALSAGIVTDRLRSYRAAMNVIGNAVDQTCGRWLNNRAENSHQPFRRREGAMARFRDVKTLQKFAATHASTHNHFNHERHLNNRDIFKQYRAAALVEWYQLAA